MDEWRKKNCFKSIQFLGRHIFSKLMNSDILNERSPFYIMFEFYIVFKAMMLAHH